MNSNSRSGFDGRRPNIVFIHAESMDGRKMGCTGHPALRNATPNLDARAKHHDKQSFRRWRDAAKAAGAYEDTMARVYSGFDRLCIEDIVPWTQANEATIEVWLKA